MLERLRELAKLPGYGLLSWKLFTDPRVPVASKVVAGLAIAFILSPLDLLDWIPLAGGAGELALIGLVLRTFINAAPEDVRAEHMAAIGMSRI